ncbi:gp043 [Rhodococcus phage ReqiPoco6]|uniref:Gp043 n=1 Tax=Rhodococcus phage ReqiPoco6 TaxID=691964 RepID=D4P7R1_9CAUD|nr:gp043 [Rhodococcus phage ReqiPoco6]ADD81041.1 gp043 [Rhodococcus phage ReqiPoco6]
MVDKIFAATNVMSSFADPEYLFGVSVGVAALHLYYRTKYKAMLTAHDLDRLRKGLPVKIDTSRGPIYIREV